MRHPLYIVSPGAHIGYQNGRLRVDYRHSGAAANRDVAIRSVSSIAIYGPANFSPYSMEIILRLGIPCHLFSVGGRFLARLCPPTAENSLLASTLLRASLNVRWSKALAQYFLRRKFNAMLRLAKDIRRNLSNCKAANAAEYVDEIHRALHSLDRDACSIAQLRGIEGALARIHFQFIGAAVRHHRTFFTMNSRMRRPPKDALNSLLSFLYSLTLGEILAALHDARLPISIGFLHARAACNTPALAYDFMEDFRSSLAERIALRLVNRSQISELHFEQRNEGVFLNRDGRATVTREWLDSLDRIGRSEMTPRQLIKCRVEAFKFELQGNKCNDG